MDQTSAATMAVLQRHMAAMDTRDPAVIAGDYAEDTVVVTTFADSPVRGRSGIEQWVREKMQDFLVVLEADVTIETLIADGEYGYLVVDLGDGRKGTETYHIKDGLIQFESATFFL